MVRKHFCGPATGRSISESGFGLVELLMLIVIIGILAAIATSSLDIALGKHRQAKTEREMQTILKAIAGDPTRMSGGGRSEFGYAGDVGAFPASLDHLLNSPGYATWIGPYIDVGLVEDSTGYLKDEWGQPYQYDGNLTVTSVGSGTSLTASLTGSTGDYLLNSVIGLVSDADGNPPGVDYVDSVELSLSVPDGIGGLSVQQIHPLSNGSFEFEDLPIGRHNLEIVYTPESDTLHRVVTVLPRYRNDNPLKYKYAWAYFDTTGPAPSSLTLRPDGVGSSNGLTRSGCTSNYLCVNESTADDDASTVARRAGNYATDLYSMEDPGTTTGVISSITLYARCRPADEEGEVKLTVRTHGNNHGGEGWGISPGWQDYSSTWTQNPVTEEPWTWQDINDIEAGVSLKGQSAPKPAYSTQVWMVVEVVP